MLGNHYFQNTPLLTDSIELTFRRSLNQIVAEADALSSAVCKALYSISEDERSDFRKKVFAGLARAGLNVRACLLLVGVSATTAGELTAPEIASLIRYVHLSEPKAMLSVATSLSELFTAAESTQAAALSA